MLVGRVLVVVWLAGGYLFLAPARIVVAQQTCRRYDLVSAEHSNALPLRRCNSWKLSAGLAFYLVGSSTPDNVPDWGIEPRAAVRYRATIPLAVEVFLGPPAALFIGGRPTQQAIAGGLILDLDMRELALGGGLGGVARSAIPGRDEVMRRPAWLIRGRIGSGDGLSLSVSIAAPWTEGKAWPDSEDGIYDIAVQLPFSGQSVGLLGLYLELGVSVGVFPQLRVLVRHRVLGDWLGNAVYVVYGYRGALDLRSDTDVWYANGVQIGLELLTAIRPATQPVGTAGRSLR